MQWRSIAQSMLNAMGLELHRTRPGAEYVHCTPYAYSTHHPWFEEWFQEIYRDIQSHTLVKEDRCYMLYQFTRHALHLGGDIAECGVYCGGTARLLASTIAAREGSPARLHLFDSFAGMPASANRDASHHSEGDFGDTSLAAVQEYLRPFSNVIFHPGFIPDTFSEVEDGRFSFVHIDVDLFESTWDCCSFFYERMIAGGIMISDDYGFPHYENAARKAIDEFFADKPESPIALRTGQCFVMKL